MGPFAVGRLLERTSFCWTENAVLNEGRSALPQPLKKTDELRTSNVLLGSLARPYISYRAIALRGYTVPRNSLTRPRRHQL